MVSTQPQKSVIIVIGIGLLMTSCAPETRFNDVKSDELNDSCEKILVSEIARRVFEEEGEVYAIEFSSHIGIHAPLSDSINEYKFLQKELAEDYSPLSIDYVPYDCRVDEYEVSYWFSKTFNTHMFKISHQ